MMVIQPAAAATTATQQIQQSSSKRGNAKADEAVLMKNIRDEIRTMRRKALYEGLDKVTSGNAQDAMHLLMNVVSQILMCCQLFINLKTLFPSVFGGEGCTHEGKITMHDILWVFIQTGLNAIVTLFQTFLWVWQLKASCCYYYFYNRFPNTKVATADHEGMRQEYAKVLAYKAVPDLDEYPEPLRRKLIDDKRLPDPEEVPTKVLKAPCLESLGVSTVTQKNINDSDTDDESQSLCSQHPTQREREYDNFIQYKKACQELGHIHTLQIMCTNCRALIGALGAIIEPLLAAHAAYERANPIEALKKLLNPSNRTDMQAAPKNTTDAVVQHSEEVASFQKCVAARQYSTSFGAMIGALGIKQAQMKTAYSKLVVLHQVVEADRASEEPKITETEVEAAMMRILGDQGKNLLGYASGKEVPDHPE